MHCARARSHTPEDAAEQTTDGPIRPPSTLFQGAIGIFVFGLVFGLVFGFVFGLVFGLVFGIVFGQGAPR